MTAFHFPRALRRVIPVAVVLAGLVGWLALVVAFGSPR